LRKPIFLFCSLLILFGCTNTGSQWDQYELNKKIADLELQNEQLIKEISDLNEQLQKCDNLIAQNEILKQQLENEIQSLQKSLNTPNFNVFEEKLIVDPNMLIPTTTSIEQVKEILREPKNIEKTNAVHGSGEDITLYYDEASFTFNKYEDQETIKWYTIKTSFFKTNRGITVGSSKEDVIRAYGNSYYNYHQEENGISIGEKTGISFMLEKNKVSEITVWLMYE
jgi:DNA gyrase/topoisomerase IV subunit A